VQAALAVGTVIAAVAFGLSFRQQTPPPEAAGPGAPSDPMADFERDLAGEQPDGLSTEDADLLTCGDGHEPETGAPTCLHP
jgi:hypothetical protein